jgi:hypothetical protein
MARSMATLTTAETTERLIATYDGRPDWIAAAIASFEKDGDKALAENDHWLACHYACLIASHSRALETLRRRAH